MFQVDKRFSNANISRTIRYTEELFEELSAVAGIKQISFNALVLQCCRYALDHMDEHEKMKLEE